MDQPERSGPPGGTGPDAPGSDASPEDPGAGGGDPGTGEVRAEGPGTALPPKAEAWRRRSAAGAILTGFALGLQQALETQRDDPSIVIQTSGDPPDDLPVEAEFEYGRPRQSVVNIRPWLLGEKGSRPAEDTDGETSE